MYIFLIVTGMTFSFQSCSQVTDYSQYKLSPANIFAAFSFENQSRTLDDNSGRYLLLGAGDSITVIDTEMDSIINK